MSPDERARALRASSRFLSGHGPRPLRAQLLELAAHAGADERADAYGSGDLIEAFEREVATLLGKPAALFLPSGTMAQLIALRLHCERAQRKTVGFHATSHLELHEHKAYARLHGLDACLIGRRDRLIEASDLLALSERIAALLLELPQRELGGELPSWESLQAQVDWARSRGVALHLDGARLWECTPFYGRTALEIAALFDSVYVSFYKALGGIAGAALAGSESFIAEARLWQRRLGGNLVTLYPLLLSARLGLAERLPRIAGYCERARAIAAIFARLPGVRVRPNPPQTNLFHAFLPVPPEPLLEAAAELARTERITLISGTRPCDAPHCSLIEVSIGDAAEAIADAELEELLERLLAGATGSSAN